MQWQLKNTWFYTQLYSLQAERLRIRKKQNKDEARLGNKTGDIQEVMSEVGLEDPKKEEGLQSRIKQN